MKLVKLETIEGHPIWINREAIAYVARDIAHEGCSVIGFMSKEEFVVVKGLPDELIMFKIGSK